MQRQGFVTTIKDVIKKKKFKSLIRFHGANKINNYDRGEKRKKKNPKETTEQVKT